MSKTKQDIGEVKLFFTMLHASFKGKYKKPWGLLALIIFFLFYLIMPIDIIPDYFFPVLGFGDDAALMLWVMAKIKKENKKFKTSYLSN